MDQRLDDVLHGREGNVLLPFLWMHDGHRGELPTLVKQVYDSGARALCVESRPHEHFCEQEWWDDMDVVLAEAERLGMKVRLVEGEEENFKVTTRQDLLLARAIVQGDLT